MGFTQPGYLLQFAMENRWTIEIDGLPFLKPFIDGLPIKHGDFPWRTVNVITRWYSSYLRQCNVDLHSAQGFSAATFDLDDRMTGLHLDVFQGTSEGSKNCSTHEKS